jgi:hypothetical protein
MYFLLIIIAIAAIRYKAYLQEKLEGATSADIPAITGFLTFNHFFPIQKEMFGSKKHTEVRNANIALAVFWIAFSLTITIPLVKAILRSV